MRSGIEEYTEISLFEIEVSNKILERNENLLITVFSFGDDKIYRIFYIDQNKKVNWLFSHQSKIKVYKEFERLKNKILLRS